MFLKKKCNASIYNLTLIHHNVLSCRCTFRFIKEVRKLRCCHVRKIFNLHKCFSHMSLASFRKEAHVRSKIKF